MKKHLLSIIALILCFCTVFVFASCGKKDVTEGDSENNGVDGSDEVLDGSENSSESGKIEDGEGLKDVDSSTAEKIFSDMKAAYNATLNYTGAYSIKSTVSSESTTTEKNGDEPTTDKTTNKIKTDSTADPAAAKFAQAITHTIQSGTDPETTDKMTKKIYSDGGKNYRYQAMGEDGAYEILSANTLAEEKTNMSIKNNFASIFTRAFGEPFSATSAANLKTVTSKVLNEVKSNTTSLYKSGAIDGTEYEIDQCVTKADILFNKTNDTNIFKRTVTYSLSLKYNGGSTKEDVTVESLLNTKNGKILSFTTTSTKSTIETLTSGGTYQTNESSTTSYDFTYSFNTTDYDKINTKTPTSDIYTAPESFAIPVALVINGTEVPFMVRGGATAEFPVSSILESAIVERFGTDITWYKDSGYATEFSFSSVSSIDALKTLKLYTNLNNTSEAYVIDYGKTTVSVGADYKTVFGNIALEETHETGIMSYTIDTVNTENNIKNIGMYTPVPGYTQTVSLNGTALNVADATEEPTGERYWSVPLEGGKLYFAKHAYTIGNTSFLLASFYLG